MDYSAGCPTASVMFGVPGVRVLATEADGQTLRLLVETDADVGACHGCGVMARLHDREIRELHDAPWVTVGCWCAGAKRVWRCHERACPTVTWAETHALAAPKALLTARAVGWATDPLADDDATVSGLAHRLGSIGTPSGTPLPSSLARA